MPASSATINNIHVAFLKLQRKLASNRVGGTATDVTSEMAGLKQHIETAKLEDGGVELKPPFFPGAFIEDPAPVVTESNVTGPHDPTTGELLPAEEESPKKLTKAEIKAEAVEDAKADAKLKAKKDK